MNDNEKALDLFADLLEPAAEIIGDKEVSGILQGGGKTLKAVKIAIKNHKEAVIEILARIDGVEPSEYKFNGFAVVAKLINLLNKPEVTELFTLQSPKDAAGSSGSATENIEDGAE